VSVLFGINAGGTGAPASISMSAALLAGRRPFPHFLEQVGGELLLHVVGLQPHPKLGQAATGYTHMSWGFDAACAKYSG
jgi:hypothetical protein